MGSEYTIDSDDDVIFGHTHFHLWGKLLGDASWDTNFNPFRTAVPKSRCGDKPLKFRVVCPKIGTAFNPFRTAVPFGDKTT